ncbi:hypothetical protein B0H66DRAFT_294170 [Apodospora peruviana]|uniref:Uncharacterized protein n=1 Tax=Apodospora peruviana TaxID=516989 RepID=A0AAE0M3C8_9PEZI|nr:hypothetical protein B0H66DRAFT_294170 [Apodospora peruviana]
MLFAILRSTLPKPADNVTQTPVGFPAVCSCTAGDDSTVSVSGRSQVTLNAPSSPGQGSVVYLRSCATAGSPADHESKMLVYCENPLASSVEHRDSAKSMLPARCRRLPTALPTTFGLNTHQLVALSRYNDVREGGGGVAGSGGWTPDGTSCRS